jgi:hypothetical protein
MVTRQIVEFPDTLAIKQIEEEGNAEVRRVMIDRFGQERYIRDSGCRPIHVDDWGEIYSKEVSGDEPVVMVKVVNSTREPDGTFKNYWIRVHPELRPMLDSGELGPPQKMTARNAVASTFGMTGEEYLLQQET